MGKNINTEDRARIKVVAALQLSPQSACPFPSGQAGLWKDSAGNYFLRDASGVDTPVGSAGSSFKKPARLASTANLAGTYNSTAKTLTVTATGLLAIDSVNVAVGDRILLKDQSTQTQNGIYVVTVAGDTGIQPVLTRASDANESGQFQPSFLIGVSAGSVNSDSFWIFTPNTFVLDTDNAVFSAAPLAITYATTGDMVALDGGAAAAGVSSKVLRADAKPAVATIADGNLTPGILVTHEIAVPDAATGHTDYVLNNKIEIVDVIVRKDTTNGGAGDTVQIQDGSGNPITDAISLNINAKSIARAGQVDSTKSVIAASGTLRVAWAKSTNVKCQITIVAIKRA